ARRSGEDMVLTVADDGCGMSRESRERFLSRDPSASGQHLGLYNVDAILRLHYGPERGLRLLSRPGERGTCIQAVLPIRMWEGGEEI
ncbi:MAG: ATP-binding protein, partial [Oscillospiraceae bacterium]|nr:ATP-binding protein [Oscillospiraceae bacterium]